MRRAGLSNFVAGHPRQERCRLVREARQDTLPIYDVKSWVMDEGAAAFNVTKPLSFTREASLTSPADSRAAGFRFATHYAVVCKTWKAFHQVARNWDWDIETSLCNCKLRQLPMKPHFLSVTRYLFEITHCLIRHCAWSRAVLVHSLKLFLGRQAGRRSRTFCHHFIFQSTGWHSGRHQWGGWHCGRHRHKVSSSRASEINIATIQLLEYPIPARHKNRVFNGSRKPRVVL